ncbi:MAG: tetratricopeptide repeat protein, partial [Candidatus Latescibacterota bacterium]|nr:tetratricopeptide repeat protein [Candidatus Latescibacterota bacterium]
LTRAIEAGNIFFARRQFARAATAYQQAIDLRPNQPSSHHNLAAVFLATGDTRQARATFQQAAELGSQIAETYRALIWLAQKAGDGDGAQRAYRLAAQHLPTSAMTALSEYLKANP